MTYSPPLDDMILALRAGAGFDAALTAGQLGDCDGELLEPVLAEAARIASEQLAPLNRIGDKAGASLHGNRVTTPPGWGQAYRQWRAGGWNGLSAPEQFGGQGLPFAFNAPCLEMWGAANMAFSLCPMLTLGAIEAIATHGNAAMQATYLPRLVSGEWTGTMLLTEPQAGSDVGALHTRAERRDDGSYRVKGTKIFITYGEHDLADNIVHLVLARLPDAPAGTRGVSLFAMPKFLSDDAGDPGARNDIFATGLEHKLGIHASPTCVMSLGDGTAPNLAANDGAIAFLLGEENRGMACMFTMMNRARLGVGLQGVGIAEAATQKALTYARERVQGRAPESKATTGDPIIAHPDVRRMLMTMHAMTAAARVICYATAVAGDIAERTQDASAAARYALLTPLAKAFSTDIANEVTSLGVQVHGGTGYIEETGAAQFMRDARIAAIYEGTNGIQAIDLVTRKLAADDCGAMIALIADLRATARASQDHAGLTDIAGQIMRALDTLEASARAMCERAGRDTPGALAGATAFLRLASIVISAGLLLKSAAAARDVNAPPAFAARHAALARFFAGQILVDAPGLAESVARAAELEPAARAVLDGTS